MRKFSGLILGMILVVMGSTAWGAIIIPPPGGSVIDPSTIFIGNPPSPALTGGGTYLFNGEVTPIPNNFLQMVVNGNGDVFTSPVYLILGIVNNNSFSLPSVTLNVGNVLASGYLGLDLTAGQEVYGLLGLTGANNSQSFTNWSAAELAVNGITANYFGLYAYAFGGTGLDGGVTLDVSFASALPVGTFAIGYGEYVGANNTKVYSTPFTESGMTDGHKVPEPGTMMLLGSGLVGLAGWGRKRLFR